MSLPQPPAPQITTCYRHPDREAGRKCTRCGRPACTECLVRADIGSQCVECAKAGKPNARTRARYWSASKPTLVTYVILGLNVAVFVWMAAANSANVGMGGRITYQQALLGLGDNLLVRTDDNRIVVVELHEQWYRLVSSGFLHYGIIHLAFNMLLLFQLGQLLEPSVGRVKFALVYLAALLGGSAGGLLLEPNGLHGGASGAVFGLLGAAAVMLLQRGINPLTTSIGSVIMLNLFITFSLRDQISVGGHLGGLVAGAAAGWFVSAPRQKGIPSWLAYAAPVIVGIAAIVLAAVVTDGPLGG